MGLETELKLHVPASRLGRLARPVRGDKNDEGSTAHLVSTYFDTPKQKLRRHGVSLRVREDGNRRVQTIKASAGARFGRGEWESVIRGDRPDLERADGTPLEHLVSRKLCRKLNPVFKTSVDRISRLIRTDGSAVELAIDRGRIVAGRRASPIDEIELELKSGRPEDLFRIARTIAREVGAELELRSKSERGYDLARGGVEHAVRAEPIQLESHMTAVEAFKLIARSCMQHFGANVGAVHLGDPEGVHQMRVGLRRARAAISLFSKILDRGDTERIKRELKWLTDELAPAREIDVFFQEKVSPSALHHVPRRGGMALKQEVARKRAEAIARARKAVATPRFRSLMIDFLAWTEEIAPDRENPAVGKWARGLLCRRAKKARKIGRHLDRLTTRQRHKFRIRIKKLRYALEFFESLFSGKRARRELRRFSEHLKKIQDALGELNDLVAHRRMTAESALNAPPQNRRARAFAAGVILGHEDQAAKPLLAIAKKEIRWLEAADAI